MRKQPRHAWIAAATSVLIAGLTAGPQVLANDSQPDQSVSRGFIDVPNNGNPIMQTNPYEKETELYGPGEIHTYTSHPSEQATAEPVPGQGLGQPEAFNQQPIPSGQAGLGEQQAGIAATGTSETLDGTRPVQVQQELAPHAVVIVSSLQSALDQLNGMRVQLQIAQNVSLQARGQAKEQAQGQEPQAQGQAAGQAAGEGNPNVAVAFRVQNRELGANLGLAQSQASQLDRSIRQFPSIANSEQFREASRSLEQVNATYSDIARKLTNGSYLSNTIAVNSDLGNLQSRIRAAIARTRALGIDRLDAPIG